MVINCRGVPYLDSTGIGFLVGLFTTMRNAGGSFALAEVGQRINNVLRLTTLNTVLAVYDTEAEALRAVIEGNARPQVRWVGNEAT